VTTAVQALTIVLASVGGTAVVLIREPFRQAMVASFYGLLLVVLFLVYQAPDVALSALVVGAIALPLMVLLVLAKVSGEGG
jgi:energy-converting hydrogenase B subunit D